MSPRWLAGLWLVALAAAAQDVTIYRCTDAQGALTIQNMPCPRGVQQQKTRMATPRAPAPAPMVAAPRPASPPVAPVPAPAKAPAQAQAPVDSAPGAAAPAPERLPPPPLFECTAQAGGRYLTEHEAAATRCLPLRVTGLDGNPATAAGSACEVVSDRCARVPDQDACEAWGRYAQEAESAWRFAAPEQRDAAEREHARLRRVLDESRCGGDGAAVR